MSKKRGRPRIVPEDVSQDEINQIKAACEDYRKALERIEDNEAKARRIQSLLESAKTPFEQELYAEDLARIEAKIQADTESTSYLRWGLSQLEPKTRSIMEQLYIEGIVWDEVQSENGDTFNSSSIWHEKEKGFRQLAIAVREKKISKSVVD